MRLRASVNNVALLAGLLHTAVGVSSPCYLHFTPTQFRLMAPAGHDGVQIWATLDASSLFSQYRVESHNHNEITLEVVAETLARALRSATGATEVMLRLGKRDGEPLLSLAITMAGHTGTKLDVTQEVLVRILRVSELSLITEPMCPTPDVRAWWLMQVYIVMPPLAEVKAVAEQIRPLATQVCLGANHSGALRLAVMDDDVVGEATWTGLEHPSVQAEHPAQPEGDPHTFHEVHLNARALQSVLSAASVAKSTVACLCADYCAVLYVYVTGPADTYATASRAHRPGGIQGIMNFVISGLDPT
ncbi:Checkpoint protein hus1 [Malassezia nana]|uniref:Checkpoint protein n=1 Tax=Malassezia nana TaxID=180528 RepID=A0AAF0EJ42_9BASI|nr:Checkpoint protein hus1 [Malassezia nana]